MEWLSTSGWSFEIRASGNCLPGEPLKLRLTPTPTSPIPTSLSPASNGDLVHSVKMSLHGHLPVFSHNLFGSASSVLAGHTENPEGEPKLQRQKDLDPHGAF